MILKATGIFILAFVTGYILGDIPVRIINNKAAEKRKKLIEAKKKQHTETLN
ncbi:MAG TPA: hypothetical protein VHB48_18065 [Chitinophagaceae bacterium]|jgi:hypothetical protein|nr:hypothetical protein [Chitinophagaceae bacterium]